MNDPLKEVGIEVNITGEAAGWLSEAEIKDVVRAHLFEQADAGTASSISAALQTQVAKNVAVRTEIPSQNTININLSYVTP